jgi:hypothetical protein
MHTLLWLSYYVLYGIIVFEGMVLRELLDQTLLHRQVYTRLVGPREIIGLPSGTPVPEFCGALLNSTKALNQTCFKGNETILVFVAPHETSRPGYRQLSTAVHALWHMLEGHVYLVCSGTRRECRQLASSHNIHGCTEHNIPMLIDEYGSISRSFRIETTPVAVELDEDSFIKRYGVPVTGSVITQ